MATRSTRRQLLARGVGTAAGLAVLAPSAQGDAAPEGHSRHASAADGQVLQALLHQERLVDYACLQAIGSGKLYEVSQQMVLLLFDHHRAHVAALKRRLQALKLPATPAAKPTQPPPPFPPQQVSDLFKQIKHEKDALQALIQVMNVVESTYFNAVASLHDAGLASLVASILANLGQHWTMIVDLLHSGNATLAVPHPYVRGAKQISKPHLT